MSGRYGNIKTCREKRKFFKTKKFLKKLLTNETATFPHPVAHPHFPLRLSPYPRQNIFIIFPWPKGHRGAYIINEFFPYFLIRCAILIFCRA